ncbi:MAG: class I SAM-dependent methyltransferase [Candidatus Bathyarchaeia archaeon]|jgi:SAM-dependent methyltransferase
MFRFPREYSESFNEDAQAYNSVRPGYPKELIEDIFDYSQIPPGGSILEIGCGTGQATLPFALRGYKVTAIELGLNLVEVAKVRCKGLDVDFITTYFENWKTNRNFDLLIAATSWHWIKQGIGFKKADEVLKDNGVIALFWNLHPSPYTGFFLDVQEIYKKLVLDWSSLRDKPSTAMWVQ